MKKTIPNYLHVFEMRLVDLRKRISAEYKKPKKEREKHTLKSIIKEIRHFEDILKEAKEEHSKKCPHCGEKI